MKKIVADVHTHTLASGHAYGTIREMAQAAKKYHAALEVNNSSLMKQDQRWNCVENYKTMLHYCKKMQVPIVINSDAHDPSAVGNFMLATKLVEAVNFDETLILNMDRSRLLSFIIRK